MGIVYICSDKIPELINHYLDDVGWILGCKPSRPHVGFASLMILSSYLEICSWVFKNMVVAKRPPASNGSQFCCRIALDLQVAIRRTAWEWIMLCQTYATISQMLGECGHVCNELVYLRNHEQVLAPDASMVGMATITQSLLSLLSVCINFFFTIWLFNIAMENPS